MILIEWSQVLSLSHNNFSALKYFESFINLVELNLNFNNILNVDGLTAPRLEKLYLSHNR